MSRPYISASIFLTARSSSVFCGQPGGGIRNGTAFHSALCIWHSPLISPTPTHPLQNSRYSVTSVDNQAFNPLHQPLQTVAPSRYNPEVALSIKKRNMQLPAITRNCPQFRTPPLRANCHIQGVVNFFS